MGISLGMSFGIDVFQNILGPEGLLVHALGRLSVRIFLFRGVYGYGMSCGIIIEALFFEDVFHVFDGVVRRDVFGRMTLKGCLWGRFYEGILFGRYLGDCLGMS